MIRASPKIQLFLNTDATYIYIYTTQQYIADDRELLSYVAMSGEKRTMKTKSTTTTRLVREEGSNYMYVYCSS